MNLKMFSLFDNKAGYFNTPFFFPYTGQAIRAMTDLGQDPNTTVGRHPADYMLFELGQFDDQTGAFTQAAPINHGPVSTMLPHPPAPLFDVTKGE